jgi:LacI family transcriptional regulator
MAKPQIQQTNPVDTTNQAGTRRATMHDVAQEAQVSIGTVSRVANKHPSVKPLVRQKVEAAIKKTGWQPNTIAQSMRTAATKTIGCILPNSINPLFSAVIKGAEETLREHGYVLIVANSNGDAEFEPELLSLILNRRVDGLLLAHSNEFDARMLDAIEHARIPIVLVEREYPRTLDSVVSDQRGGLLLATEHLFAFGHQRIALLTGNPASRPGRERHRGFVEAHQQANIKVHPELLRLSSLAREYAYQEIQNLMRADNPPTAIITGGNVMLAGALHAINLMGIRVPEDVSLIAVGDTDLAELASPSITAVRWDLEGIGRDAANILIKRINRSTDALLDAPTHTIIPTEIVLRRSCAAPSQRSKRNH